MLIMEYVDFLYGKLRIRPTDLPDRRPVTRHATLAGMDAMRRMPQEVLAQWECEESVKIMRKRRESLGVL